MLLRIVERWGQLIALAWSRSSERTQQMSTSLSLRFAKSATSIATHLGSSRSLFVRRRKEGDQWPLGVLKRREQGSPVRVDFKTEILSEW